MKRFVFLAAISLIHIYARAQDKPDWDYEWRGYLKHFSSYGTINENFFEPSIRPSLQLNSFDQQLHNRFDLKIYRGAWSAGLGMRNRLFNGSQLKSGDLFFNILDADPGLVDLSLLYWRSEDAVLHTIFDRLWLQYENDKLLLRIGRQRINWGINSIWNPNDILNQYNFFDFDYEERPGADAIRLQYFSSFTSSWELAIAPGNKLEESTAALLYRNNKYTYDFQLLSAYYQNNLSLGGGWAGSLWDLGFKGEANYYWALEPEESNVPNRGLNTDDAFVFGTEIDYVFGNGLYLSLSYLYNSSAATTNNLNSFSSFSPGVVLSPKNPFPFEQTAAFSANYAFNPIINGSLNFMYDPLGNNVIFFPSLSYSLSTNLDVLLAGQLFLTENQLLDNQVQWLSNNLFARLKWSF